MASGKPIIDVIREMPPATLFATWDVRPGGSSPVEALQVLDFDATAIEYMDFLCRLSEDYAGGGLTLTLAWMATSATSGAVRWEAAVRRLVDDAEDIDGAHTYDFNGVTATTASATGEQAYDAITFTDGADMDSWAAGEYAIVRIRRDPTNGGDDLVGDSELIGWSGRES